MNSLYLILLSQILFAKVRAGPDDPPKESPLYKPSCHPPHLCSNSLSNHRTLPLDNVKLKVTHDGKTISRVNLKRTNRVLANKYLPVWISTEKVTPDKIYSHDGVGLNRNYDVMTQLGEFTTYHDPESSAAAVYFHKRREFNGMIDYEFLIQHLSIDRISDEEETIIELNRDGLYRRSAYTGHLYDCREISDDPLAGVSYQGLMKTYQGRVYDGYPEVLVIVSSGVVKDWVGRLPTQFWYKAIVSHVITLFNGIDMLYSKLEKPKIQINLAGIIIEEGNSFMFLKRCYFAEPNVDQSTYYKLDGECVNSLLRTYLYGRKQKFPTDSFDMAIYLTRENIYRRRKEVNGDNAEPSSELVAGLSGSMDELYTGRTQNLESILLAIVTYREYLDHYPTIAHEMAHLMTIMHDKLPFFTYDNRCMGNILKTGGGWCKNCLSWSEISKRSFRLFFSSPNCCIFINEPRSLRPPGRHVMLTGDEQCQCYGHESATNFRQFLARYCHTNLACNAANGDIVYTVLPTDGTPCRQHEVCSDARCKNIEVF